MSVLLNEFEVIEPASAAADDAAGTKVKQSSSEKVRVNEFKRIKPISVNGRSSVWLCEREGVPYAVKSISRQYIEKEEGSEGLYRVLREREVLSTLQSSHFIRLEYALIDSTHLHFVTDYKANGNLAQWMEAEEN